MNTKNKQDQKSQRQKTRQGQGPKKRGQNSNMLRAERKHEDHEYPETRLTR
jgi:hypothetical protein